MLRLFILYQWGAADDPRCITSLLHRCLATEALHCAEHAAGAAVPVVVLRGSRVSLLARGTLQHEPAFVHYLYFTCVCLLQLLHKC